MPLKYRIGLILSIVFLVIGTFLPWGCGGGFSGLCEAGTDIFFQNGFHFQDHGGIGLLLMVMLAATIPLFKTKTYQLDMLFAMFCALAVVVNVVFYFCLWIWTGIQEQGQIGASHPGIGFAFLFPGALGLSWVTFVRVRSYFADRGEKFWERKEKKKLP